jgi:2,3-diketo-5-methylthio-1-phosphopentane phosphatase
MGIVLFVDFDGTITKEDTCAAMVEAFAGDGWREINDRWERKEISTEQCANMTFNLFQADLNDLKRLLDTMEIDEYFMEFLAFCRKRNHLVYVLSDGYDFCIDAVFDKYDIEAPYYANKMVYDGGFKIECPGSNPSCGICGTCKTRLMEKLKGEGNTVIYIGDGYSDTCPATKADIVFAKKDLYRFCRDNGISVKYFDDFSDIISYLVSMK